MAYNNWDAIKSEYESFVDFERHGLDVHSRGILAILPQLREQFAPPHYDVITSHFTLCFRKPNVTIQVCIWCDKQNQYHVSYHDPAQICEYGEVLVSEDEVISTVQSHLDKIIFDDE
ncbi:MAG: hypothetical protein AAFV98_14870 [Chloroflexota bacterium]